jgi:hypothetical protein
VPSEFASTKPLPVRIYEAVRESLVLAFFGSLHIAAVGQHSHGTRRPVGDMQDVRTVLFALLLGNASRHSGNNIRVERRVGLAPDLVS